MVRCCQNTKTTTSTTATTTTTVNHYSYYYYYNRRLGLIALVATKVVKPQKQFFVSYGPAYWGTIPFLVWLSDVTVLLPNFNISLDWEPPSEYDESADEEGEGQQRSVRPYRRDAQEEAENPDEGGPIETQFCISCQYTR
jgi:hypothetical protein